jgi:hypothetical protein
MHRLLRSRSSSVSASVARGMLRERTADFRTPWRLIAAWFGNYIYPTILSVHMVAIAFLAEMVLAASVSVLLWACSACMGRGTGYVEPPPGIRALLFRLCIREAR